VPASEGLEPRFGCFWFNVAEAVRKQRGSSLQLSKDPFDGIPISVAFGLKSETCSLQGSLEVLRTIDEEHGGFDIVFIAQFAKKDFGECGRGGRKQPDVKQIVRFGIASSVQPKLLVGNPNHCFVKRDLIR